MSDPQMVPQRDYMEMLVVQLKEVVRSEVSALRADLQRIESNYVAKGEFERVVGHLTRELERVEKASTERREEAAKDLKEFKDDLRTAQARTLTLWGMGIGVVSTAIGLVIKFIQ